MPIELIDREQLTKLRKEKELSIQAAAKATRGKITRQQWGNIESGKSRNPQLDTLEAMAKVFGLTAKDLLK